MNTKQGGFTDGKEKFLSIKSKILAIILPVIVLVVVAIISIAYYMSSNMIEQKAYSMLDSSVKNQVTQIDNWLSNNLQSFNTIKQAIGSTDYSAEEMKNVLNQYYNFNSNFSEGLYISDLKGNVFTAENSNLTFSDVTSSNWFNEGLTHINMKYGDPYKNSDGNYVISATGLIVNDGQPLGVIGADVTLNRISIIVNSLIDMENAQAFLVDKNTGMVLASSDALEINSTLDENNDNKFYAKIAEKIGESDYYAESIENNIVKIKDIDNTSWVLVSYVPKNSIFESIYNLRNYMIVVAIVGLIVLLLVTDRAVHHMIKPLNEISQKIVKMSAGDFNIKMNIKGNDEITLISRSMENFINYMRSMIENIKTISAEQKKQSEESDSIARKLFESSKNQTESMNNLNIVVGELAGSTEQIADTATNLAGIVSLTSKNGNMVEEKMNHTVTISENGKNDMEHVGKAMNTIQTSIEQLEKLIENVGNSSKEINNIVSIISEIAESTNLLALNASIEAARAGDAGKGFAVVATEISSLANSSSSSVKHIASLVGDINNVIENVVTKVHESVTNVNESTGIIKNSIGTFDEIYGTIKESSALVNNMLKQFADVNDAADNMAAISEEQAASAEEISSTAHEISESSRNITSDSKYVSESADNLLVTAKKLEQEVEIFKL